MRRRRRWFYLPNMVLVLPSFSKGRLGSAVLTLWRLFPLVEEATEVPALVGAIKALRAQGLTAPVVVRTFIQRWILQLRERAHPLW
jgi:hypothetical protein